MSDELRRLDHGVIDLSQFREKKKEEEKKLAEPLFTEPTIITLGDPNEEGSQLQYLLLVNIVLNDKQFLALESMEKDDRGQVAIVEAVVENGQFAGVQVVQSEEEFEEVADIITQALTNATKEVADIMTEALDTNAKQEGEPDGTND